MSRRSALVLGSLRERGTITLVGALCGAYATILLLGAATISTLAGSFGGVLHTFLTLVASVFFGIALYVGAVVISGCTATVIAGRERQIATLRLLGADVRSLQRSIASGCAQAAGLGALLGVGVGHLVAWSGRAYLVDRGSLPHHAYPVSDPRILVALAAVVGCGLVAGRLGARRVLSVNPASAMGSATPTQQRTARRARAVVTTLGLVGGSALMALACRLGETSPSAGFPCAFFGCAAFATGILVGAPFVVPRLVSVFAGALGRDASARIARRNAVADPMRTSRSTLGLVIGAGLVTTVLSGVAAIRAALPHWNLSAEEQRIAQETLTSMANLMTCIIAVSSVIAAVGFVSTMSLVVIQRRREIGMLRAMGFTNREVTGMVTKESVALGLTAVLLGMGLGVLFGSVASQALLGGLNRGFVWGVPTTALVTITVAGVVLVLVAALPPARRATRVTPVEALRVG